MNHSKFHAIHTPKSVDLVVGLTFFFFSSEKKVTDFRVLSEPRACGRPEQPPNSTMTVTTTTDRNSGSAYEVGATVEYTCNAGSLLIGPSTRTCLDTGFYNEFPPVCKSKRPMRLEAFGEPYTIVSIADVKFNNPPARFRHRVRLSSKHKTRRLHTYQQYRYLSQSGALFVRRGIRDDW